MASATGVVVIKQFTYRGDATEQWSSKYWLTGPTPGPTVEWQTLFDELVLIELQLYTATTKVVGGIGYDDDTPGANAVWTVDYSSGGGIPGTLIKQTDDSLMAGDQAGLIQWRTNRKNSRGKWIYLRKYAHGGTVEQSNPDSTSLEWNTRAAAYAAELFNGFGTQDRKIRSQKQVEDLAAHEVSPWITTRTLKRRGKRP